MWVEASMEVGIYKARTRTANPDTNFLQILRCHTRESRTKMLELWTGTAKFQKRVNRDCRITEVH